MGWAPHGVDKSPYLSSVVHVKAGAHTKPSWHVQHLLVKGLDVVVPCPDSNACAAPATSSLYRIEHAQ